MKKTTQIFKVMGLLLISAGVSFCGKKAPSAADTIKELEKCLGTVKSMSDAKDLSKEKAVEMANCMMPHLTKMKEAAEKMEAKEKEAYMKEWEEALNKSEYKDFLKSMNYNRIEKLAKMKGENEEGSKSAGSGGNCDEFLDKYETFMKDYIAIIKKYKDNPTDASILSEYQKLQSEANNFPQPDDCAADEKFVKKYTRIQEKIAKAVSGI
jgi:hypothetical protein